MRSEIIEAREIISKLSAISGQLRPGDARFVETWANYLKNAGDQAQIGRWRMESLWRVARSYGLIEAQDGESVLRVGGLD